MKRLFDAEMKVMEIVWEKAPITAKEISAVAAETIGWSKNTTYTVITKLVQKGYLHRTDPNFVCTALVSRDEVQKTETKTLIDRLFGGSRKALFSALLEDEALSDEEIAELQKMIEKR